MRCCWSWRLGRSFHNYGMWSREQPKDPWLCSAWRPRTSLCCQCLRRMKNKKWNWNKWSVPMQWQEWMCRGGRGLGKNCLKTFPEKQFHGGEEAFYNETLTAWSQRWGLKLLDHIRVITVLSQTLPPGWKKTEDFSGLVLCHFKCGRLRPFFALLGMLISVQLEIQIDCFLTWAALISCRWGCIRKKF